MVEHLQAAIAVISLAIAVYVGLMLFVKVFGRG